MLTNKIKNTNETAPTTDEYNLRVFPKIIQNTAFKDFGLCSRKLLAEFPSKYDVVRDNRTRVSKDLF